MENHTIITIGRQFGSGGHEIGNCLTKKLNIPLYDRNLLNMAANELGISIEEAADVDETVLGKFLSAYVVNMKSYTAFVSGTEVEKPLSDQVYEAQRRLIQRLAKRGPCIMVGRCADYILGDYSNCIHTFIHAYKDDRIRRIQRLYNLTEKQAEEKLRKVDKERQLYYEVHTGRPWGSIESHQMLFNASLLGIDRIVDILAVIYERNC